MHRSCDATRRTLACALAAALIGCVPPALPASEDFPARPIRFIVPFAPGGGTDIAARIYAPEIARRLKQDVIVDNRPGAAGAIGVDITAKATPDGHTICVISASHAINSATNAKLPYDLSRDVQGVSQITAAFLVLTVQQAFAAKSVKELIAHARANPGKLNYGSSGTGGISHLAGAMFGQLTRTDAVHVPYRGEAAALTDLLGGRTQFQFASPLNAASHLGAGRLRALAVTSAQRSPAMPEIPTVAEAGVPGFEVSQWYGVVTAPKVPRAILNTLASAIAAAAAVPELGQRVRHDGLESVASTPAAFSAHVNAEVAKWRKLVKDAGLTLQ